MADLYGTSPPGNAPPHESEDISTFLHHLLNSESSSSTPFKPKPMHAGVMLPSADFHRQLGLNFSDPGLYFSDSAIASPNKRGLSAENDLGDFSCDSEGTGGVSEVQLNPAPSSRTSSKRTRAAEVHNLSEKRRRSRINEKMKALQNLVPNSNKTDKASMLDEAIEYLKQLQLQVQMLSMRNGMSLHPMCLGGLSQHVQLSQMGMGFDEEGNGLPSSTREAPQLSEISKRTVFNLSNQNTTNLQNATPSETPFSFEQAEYEPFTLPTSSKEICKEVTLLELQGDMSRSGKNSSSSVS